jgi:hypothetical protein
VSANTHVCLCCVHGYINISMYVSSYMCMYIYTWQSFPLRVLKCTAIEICRDTVRIGSQEKFPVARQRLNEGQALDPKSGTLKGSKNSIIIPNSRISYLKINFVAFIPEFKRSYSYNKMSDSPICQR